LPQELAWTYLSWQRLGINEDPRKENFEKIQTLNFEDIKNFQQEYVTKKPRTFVVLGNTKEMDMKFLKTIGKVKVLKLEEVFGF
jgi:predicted Zn-dependent peptidase